MHWLRGLIAIGAVTTIAGCDRLSRTPPEPGPSSAQAEPLAAPVDVETYAGRTYADFAASLDGRFSAEALGFTAADDAHLQGALAAASGVLLQGGGAQALVFRGCAEGGCADGVAVVAIDGATGDSFVGVRDGAGEHVLASNDRLEALLRLNAPSRKWVDAGTAQAPAGPVAAAARP